MSLRTIEIPVTPGKPFEHCKLGREKYAVVLSKIIETYSDGFVLALNNRWGEGKSTFVRMWRVYLGNNGFNTIYLNAWEHDFGQDPLAAILSEIKTLDLGKDETFKSIVSKGAKLTLNLLPVILKAIAEKHINTDSIKEGIQEISESAVELFDAEIENYTNKKEGIEDFKKQIELYLKNLEKPLVFFVDELDRCNPKYAVEFLEVVKHFFSVPGIVFVLSIDKVQLGYAIQGYFGNHNLDSTNYLKRFFEIEYSIPAPNSEKLIKLMFSKFQIYEMDSRFNYQALKDLEDISKLLLRKSELSIRSIEKIFLQIKLALLGTQRAEFVLSELLFLLIFIKHVDFDFYQDIQLHKLTVQELSDRIFELIQNTNSDGEKYQMARLEAELLFLYSNMDERKYLKYLYKETPNGDFKLLFIPRFDDLEGFIRNLKEFRRGSLYSYSLEFLLERIELLRGFS